MCINQNSIRLSEYRNGSLCIYNNTEYTEFHNLKKAIADTQFLSIIIVVQGILV